MKVLFPPFVTSARLVHALFAAGDFPLHLRCEMNLVLPLERFRSSLPPRGARDLSLFPSGRSTFSPSFSLREFLVLP